MLFRLRADTRSGWESARERWMEKGLDGAEQGRHRHIRRRVFEVAVPQDEAGYSACRTTKDQSRFDSALQCRDGEEVCVSSTIEAASADCIRSSTPLTNEYARKIPLLTKKKEEAARRAEEARHQARDQDDGTRTRSPRAPSRRDPQIAEEDPELSQQFWEFELQRAKEQDDRTIQERAALLQAENNTRQRLEEDRQQEIARKAIEDYKLQQEEMKARIMAREKQLSDELLALGLGPEQVASVLAIPSLKVDETRSNAISRRRSTESQRTSLSEVDIKVKPQRKRLSDFAIKFLSW